MENNTNYYGVYIPNDLKNINGRPQVGVFTDKSIALKVIKEHKKARFKVFKTHEEAEEFSKNGAEQPQTDTPATPTQPLNTKQSNNGEPKFRGPPPQSLVQFRKCIENNELLNVERSIWENPRYLISSGDTPSILKEGQRYNALHVAAIAKNVNMCELILKTITDINFMFLFYGDGDVEMCEDRSNTLLDLYLNTPDKGLNETPIHFAAKYGAADCVELLASYPTCDRNLRNRHGQLPNEMICLRVEKDDKVVDRIARALAPLEDKYYVPVVRSTDDTIIPEVGIPFNANSPPKLNEDPLSPQVDVYAFAGPMEISTAHSFRKKWKTPPRLLNPSSRFTKSNDETSPFFTDKNMSSNALRKILNDPDKGLERIGRELAHQHEVGWKEFWPFLNTFTDLNSKEGLDLLEKYLEQKYLLAVEEWNSQIKQELVECQKEESNSRSKQEEFPKSDNNNVISKENTKEIISPMSDLCRVFANSCKINDNSFTENGNLEPFNGALLNGYEPTNPSLNPFLCVSKSLQVFGIRIFDILRKLYKIKEKSDHEYLKIEIRHLISLIASYKSDKSFNGVEFEYTHLRVAEIVSEKMYEDFYVNRDEFNLFLKYLNRLAKHYIKDDKPYLIEHISCILSYIQKFFNEGGSLSCEGKRGTLTEDECKTMWSRGGDSCRCSWIPDETFRKKRTRSINSDRVRQSINSHNESDIRPRRLLFDDKDDYVDAIDGGDTNVCADADVCAYVDACADDSDDESDEQFYTPPSTPNSYTCDDLSHETSDDEMMDTSYVSAFDVYLEEDLPTKTDAQVYYAIRKNPNILNVIYPHIYKWRHRIELYSEDERESWQSILPKNSEYCPSPQREQTPSKSRLQRTSMYSPLSRSMNSIGSPLRGQSVYSTILEKALTTPLKPL